MTIIILDRPIVNNNDIVNTLHEGGNTIIGIYQNRTITDNALEESRIKAIYY